MQEVTWRKLGLGLDELQQLDSSRGDVLARVNQAPIALLPTGVA
jgi:hypothetical protein